VQGCGISNCGGARGSKNAAKAQQTKTKKNKTGVQGYHERRCAKKRNDKHGGVWDKKKWCMW